MSYDKITDGHGIVGSLTVKDDLTVGDDASVAGDLSVTGAVNSTGELRSGALPTGFNAGGVKKLLMINLAAVGTGTETDTGANVPASAIVTDVFLVVDTAEATGGTKTLTVGTAVGESGDADGYLAAVDVSGTGVKKGTLASGGQTLGALLRADEDGAGALVPEADVASGGKSIVWTEGSNDWVEFVGRLFIEYIDTAALT